MSSSSQLQGAPLLSSAAAASTRSAAVCDTPPVGNSRSNTPEYGTSSKWGRKGDSDWCTALSALGMMVFAPMFVWFCLWSCAEHDCSMRTAGGRLIDLLVHKSPSSYMRLWSAAHVVTFEAVAVWCCWFAAQVLLYMYAPGPLDAGQPTPAGYTLRYKVNGWNVWMITHVAVVGVLYFVTGFSAASVVPRNWLALFWVANFAGWTLALLSYVKASIAPTHRSDNKYSGSIMYDIFMGVEHNPRLSSHPYSFDFKQFFNGRPGICAWTLINLCFAAHQYQRFGFVSNSMIILNMLHAIYVLDFFWNEGWYLRTIDICHEHFGFYLAWGDLVWLPFMYTLQGLFLASHPVQLTPLGCAGVLALGLGGYALFRAVNAEKDRFRKEMKRLDALSMKAAADNSSVADQEEPAPTHQGQIVTYRGQIVSQIPKKTWGEPTRYLAARYHTGQGNEERHSYLLLSGFWGLSRHMNYLGDLMVSLAFCLTTGFTHVLPYFYIVYMTILLLHRVWRDDEKCRQKYGRVWDKYCSIVQYKVCPYVY